MTKITIPPAALEAGARAVADVEYPRLAPRKEHYEMARAAFLAMVESWPKWLDMDADPGAALILPLMEKPDDKAR